MKVDNVQSVTLIDETPHTFMHLSTTLSYTAILAEFASRGAYSSWLVSVFSPLPFLCPILHFLQGCWPSPLELSSYPSPYLEVFDSDAQGTSLLGFSGLFEVARQVSAGVENLHTLCH